MGEIIYGLDFKSKKRLTPELAIAEVGLLLTPEQHVTGLSLDCSPEVLLSVYEQAAYMAAESDPA